MKLVDNWAAVLRRAWSVRLILLAGLLTGLEAALALLDTSLLGLPAGALAGVAVLVNGGAFAARLLAQRGINDDHGGAKPKVVAGSAAALALAAALIAPWEGVEMRAYRDIVGVPTICYGETRGVQMGDTATLAQCQAQLARAVAEFDRDMAPCVLVPVSDKTRAALISFSYNLGPRILCTSQTMRAAMERGDIRRVCEAMSIFNRAGGRVVRGLTNRRAAERALCLEGL